MDFKDAKAVMDLWGQTSPGDWEADTYNFCVKCPDWGIAQIYYDDDDRPCDETESFYSVADTVFTAIAHQALPYWVQEAERLKKELKTLKDQHEGLKIAYRLSCSKKNREDKNFGLEG